jgi:hypothetical protein
LLRASKRSGSADVKQPVKDADAEPEGVQGDPLVDTVEHAREVQVRRQAQRAEPEAADAELGEMLRIGPGGQAVGDHDRFGILGAQGRGHRVPQGAVRRRLKRDVVVDELPADRRAEQPVELGEELFFPAGQEAAVEFAERGLRDDVDLVAGLEPGRLAVCCVVAPIILLIPPSFPMMLAGSCGSNSRPSAWAARSRNARVESGSCVGHWCRPTLASASESVVTALSGWIIDPCPAVPVAVSRIQARPFSAVCTA